MQGEGRGIEGGGLCEVKNVWCNGKLSGVRAHNPGFKSLLLHSSSRVTLGKSLAVSKLRILVKKGCTMAHLAKEL